jgi:hypothetical protein
MQEIALVILSIALILQLSMGKTPASRGFFGLFIFIFATTAILGWGIFLSWKQYLLWEGNELGKLLLPPHQSWDYFIFFSRSRFFNQYIISLIFAIIFSVSAGYLNKKSGGKFFEPAEPYLLATAVFLSGHPGWLFYLVFILLFGAVLSGWHFLRIRHEQRLSFYYLWLPGALFTILISRWLADLPWWQILKL